jgi:hypothetical protein
MNALMDLEVRHRITYTVEHPDLATAVLRD